jgi:predicted  nucleic acid-binding Zn-ribbon protein
MAIKEVQLPLENSKRKLRSELKSLEKAHANQDGADSNFHYTEGKIDGIRLAIYLISKEEQRLSEVEL